MLFGLSELVPTLGASSVCDPKKCTRLPRLGRQRKYETPFLGSDDDYFQMGLLKVETNLQDSPHSPRRGVAQLYVSGHGSVRVAALRARRLIHIVTLIVTLDPLDTTFPEAGSWDVTTPVG